MDLKDKIGELVDVIQDCNINFLLGSGLSCPFLPTLGNFEKLLNDLEVQELDNDQKELIRACIYKKYFNLIITPNLKILEGSDVCKNEMLEYKSFMSIFTDLLNFRKNTLLNRQANVFTTNIDIFLEKVLEDLQIQFNDGFTGRFEPVFELSEFKKSVYKKSLHYDNSSEIPVYNVLKIHGALTWFINKNKVEFSKLGQLNKIAALDVKDYIIDVDLDKTILEYEKEIKTSKKKLTKEVIQFLEEYKKLGIINPTKEKFAHTILNEIHYEILRIFTNELEKENTVLFVLGFSMSDEHIRNLTVRAARSNPTLKIYVICYNNEAKSLIEENLKKSTEVNYSNIEFISPTFTIQKAKSGDEKIVDDFLYDFKTINEKIFRPILKSVNLNKA